jgi:hypothetical protein
MEVLSFDLGISLDPAKRKRTSHYVRKKLSFTNAHDAALTLGISGESSALGSQCTSNSPVDVLYSFSPSDALIVSSTESIPIVPSFLLDTGEDDAEVESVASAANDKRFQNRFNEFLVQIKYEPLLPALHMYSWEQLGTDLLPRFFKCLLKKDGSRYLSG